MHNPLKLPSTGFPRGDSKANAMNIAMQHYCIGQLRQGCGMGPRQAAIYNEGGVVANNATLQLYLQRLRAPDA